MSLSRARFLTTVATAASAAAAMERPRTSASALQAISPELRRRVRRLAREHHVPSVAIASIAEAALDHLAVGPRAADVFEAASLSKPVFALAVMRLVESRALDLDRPIATIVDLEFETSDSRVLRITPRHALSHTTGLPNWRFTPSPLRCAFEPGERFSYSGEGIFLLQRAVETITGRGLADVVRTSVLAPLGMSSSTFAFERDLESRMVAPHDGAGHALEWRTMSLGRQLLAHARRRGRPLDRWRWEDVRATLPKLDPPQKPLPVFSTINAASSLLTTANDYARVCAAISRHRAMTVPQIDVTERIAWGLGVGLERTRPATAFHWGDNDGFKAMMLADVSRPRGAVVLTDADGGMSVAIDALSHIAGTSHPALPWIAAKYPSG